MDEATVISGKPDVRPLGIPKRAKLLQDVVVDVRGREWTVKAGKYDTDLASFPPLTRGWFFSWTEAPYAAVWHDERFKEKDITREEADRGFYQLAITSSPDGEVKGMPKWKAAMAYAGLRVNGETWNDGGFRS